MTGMAVNIHLWRHLLHRVEFDCAVDHKALPYIMKAKTLPATTRIIRLLEIPSGYAFNLYFVKGKDMKICDFLSRIDVDRGNPGEVIPISFNSFSMLNMLRKATLLQANKLLTITRSKTQAEGIALPPVHGAQKHLNPTVKPEYDKPMQVANQPQKESPAPANVKPRVPVKPKMPASQIVRKKLIDRSIKLLNKSKLPTKAPREVPTTQRASPTAQREIPQPLPKEDSDDVSPPFKTKRPTNSGPVSGRHFEPNPLSEIPQTDQFSQETIN